MDTQTREHNAREIERTRVLAEVESDFYYCGVCNVPVTATVTEQTEHTITVHMTCPTCAWTDTETIDLDYCADISASY